MTGRTRVDHRGRICVFAKPPRAGEAKTRLAPALGPAGAAALAGAFLRDTWAAVSALPWARAVLATTGPLQLAGPKGEANKGRVFSARSAVRQSGPRLRGADCWTRPEAWLQGDGDLGARLERVLVRALADAPWAMAIGADSPGLPAALLELARDGLARHDAVLGPAEDGGFYLLGLRRCPEGLLAGLPWSAPDTFARTAARLSERGLATAVLPGWFDVDVPADLARLQRLLARGELAAPHTARALARLSTRLARTDLATPRTPGPPARRSPRRSRKELAGPRTSGAPARRSNGSGS